MAKRNLIPVHLGEDSHPDNTVGGLALITDDDYLFMTTKLDYIVNNDDRPQYTLEAIVMRGDNTDLKHAGTTISERFTFPSGPDDDWGVKGRNRFHAWLEAADLLGKSNDFNLDGDAIAGVPFRARTYTQHMKASDDGRFEARDKSSFAGFAEVTEEDEEFLAELEKPKKKAAPKAAAAKPATKPRRADPDEDDEPPARKRRADPDDDDDEPPARKRRNADPDDEDEPAPVRKAKRPRDEDEDDEPPARRKRQADPDEDDEPAPKAKRKPANDDDDDDDIFPAKGKGTKGRPAPAAKGRRSRDEDDE